MKDITYHKLSSLVFNVLFLQFCQCSVTSALFFADSRANIYIF